MTLLNTFSNKTIKELVSILESGNDFTLEAKKAATTILELKNIKHEELVIQASNYWADLLKKDIKYYLLNKEKPESFFLNEKEISVLFKSAFDEWKENQKTFEIDTTKYWFV